MIRATVTPPIPMYFQGGMGPFLNHAIHVQPYARNSQIRQRRKLAQYSECHRETGEASREGLRFLQEVPEADERQQKHCRKWQIGGGNRRVCQYWRTEHKEYDGESSVPVAIVPGHKAP